MIGWLSTTCWTRACFGRPPEIEVTDEYGVIHRLWAIADPEAVSSIQDAMRPQKLFIADGHHRFETSVNFMRECEQRHWQPVGVESFDKRMVACFNITGWSHHSPHAPPDSRPSRFRCRIVSARSVETHFAVEICSFSIRTVAENEGRAGRSCVWILSRKIPDSSTCCG